MNEVAQKVKGRLNLFIEHLGYNNSSFEKKCGLSNGYIRNFKGNLGGKKLEDILNAFPQLNRDWLLFGTGEMLNSSENNQPQNPVEEKPQGGSAMVDTLLALVESQRKDIETLIEITKNKDKRIEELTQDVMELNNEINLLKIDSMMQLSTEKGNARDVEDSLSASAI